MNMGTERRSTVRVTPLLKIGMLHAGGDAEPCLIKNLSSKGALVRVYRRPARVESCRLEYAPGQSVAALAAWSGDWDIGLRFTSPVEVEQILASGGFAGQGFRQRLPRIAIDCFAQLRVGGRYFRGALKDISQGGARVVLREPVTPSSDVALTLPELRPLRGCIRWASDDIVGLSFNERLSFVELAEWVELREIRNPAALPDIDPNGGESVVA